MKRFDLNLLVALDVLLAEGSVSKAAARLNLTQSALSATLARLRIVFNDPLFTRSSRGMVATPRARELIRPLHGILGQIDRLVEPDSTFDPGTAELDFTIAAFEYMQFRLITPLIKLFNKKSPGIRLELRRLDFSNIGKQLESGEVDLCITSTIRKTPQLDIQPLYSERFVCVARKRHPKLGAQLTLNQFCSFDHLLLNPSPLAEKTDGILASLGRSRRVAMVVPDYSTFVEALCASDMLGMMPLRLAQTYARRLEIREPPFESEKFTFAALWHPRTNMSPAHRWLRERVITLLTEESSSNVPRKRRT